jgi:hypothetical protein
MYGIKKRGKIMDIYTATEQAYKNGYANAVKKFANYLKEHSCSYDLDNYFRFDAVDIDNLDYLVEKFLSKE